MRFLYIRVELFVCLKYILVFSLTVTVVISVIFLLK